ncbi:MAG: L-rhamnose mutarotase [Rhodobacteraceae bacterium]|nr:L-rhamnose mutarotase [Paracoccaceae bacterium]
MTLRIACIGEPLAEISHYGETFGVGFAGDTLNTAIYCAREAKGHDIDVQYVCAIGHDALSEGALNLMRREGLGTDYVTRDPARQIGIYAIQNDIHGERSFHYWRDSSAARQMFSTDASPHLKSIKSADLVYLSGITLAILSQDARDRLWRALAEQRASGLKVAFDSNYRPNLWETPEIASREIARFWKITDIALPTHEDETALFGDAERRAILDRILATGPKTGALKCGQDGPIQIPHSAETSSYKAAETVIDTTGAGDSFNGAYLAAIASGKPERTALALAHDLARRVVGHKGAILPQNPIRPAQRMGSVIGLRPEDLDEYVKLHANVWPGVLARLKASHFTNYSIYLKEPECLMFGYFEYTGDDFDTDNAAIANDPITQDWWKVCGPMQVPLEIRNQGEWWAEMREVFHMD